MRQESPAQLIYGDVSHVHTVSQAVHYHPCTTLTLPPSHVQTNNRAQYHCSEYGICNRTPALQNISMKSKTLVNYSQILLHRVENLSVCLPCTIAQPNNLMESHQIWQYKQLLAEQSIKCSSTPITTKGGTVPGVTALADINVNETN